MVLTIEITLGHVVSEFSAASVSDVLMRFKHKKVENLQFLTLKYSGDIFRREMNLERRRPRLLARDRAACK